MTNECGSRMTVMIITDILCGMGGAERNLYQVAHGLRDKGHRVLICSLIGGSLTDLMGSEGFYVRGYDSNARLFDSYGIKMMMQIAWIAKKEKVSVLMTYHKSSDYLGFLISRVTGIPVVSSRRDMGFLLKPRDVSIYRFINRYFGAIITVSNAVKDMIVQTQNGSPEKVRVIHNGVDQKTAEGQSCENLDAKIIDNGDKAVNACCLANIRYIKGQNILVEAAHIILKEYPSTRFYLAGAANPDLDQNERDYYDNLMKSIRDYQIEKEIIFLGPIDPDKIQDLFHKMDIAVCPSLSEGMSNAMLEAMISGRPIVATAVGGNPELVRDGINGYLVPPSNPRALADALIKLIKSRDLQDTMGQQSKTIASTEFSIPLMIDKYEDVLKSVIRSQTS